MKQIIITIAACLTATALLHAQATIFVKPDGMGAGTSWTNACSLDSAVKKAISGDQIWVQKGTYHPSKMLVVVDSVKIYGGFYGTETALSQRIFSANPTIVDGQHEIGSIFRLEKSAEINGFTIQSGNANGNSQKNGGGVWAEENAVIENCKIINNMAMLNGGGVYANGKVEIINTTIKDNTAMGNGMNTFGNCLIIEAPQSSFSLSITFGCNDGMLDLGEVSFKSNKITTISSNGIHQEWSDVVMAEGCNKITYAGGTSGNYDADCRAHTDRSLYGDFFSWCAVVRFAHILCPDNWRVPTDEDFGNLDIALGGKGDGTGPGSGGDAAGKWYTDATIHGKYINVWGASYCGLFATEIYNHGKAGYYWSQSEYSINRGFLTACYAQNPTVRPHMYSDKSVGISLRCIR